MGLRIAVVWGLGLFFASALFNPCLSENNVTLESLPWPNSSGCEICVSVQFEKLEMRLPLSKIGKILVAGSGAPVLHILPNTNAPRESVLFSTVPPERLIRRYRKLGFLRGLGVTTNEQFFDLLGNPPRQNKSLATMRTIENIGIASHYFKTSKDSIHAYWIDTPPPNLQRIYFVIDGEETVYSLWGNITQELYDAVLSNLRVVDVP